MKQYTTLWLAIILLFILNMVTLCVMFSGHQRPPGPPAGNRRFDRRVIETLQLTDAQIQQFEMLKRKHRSAMQLLDDSMHQVYDTYFSQLKSTVNQQTKDSLEHSISNLYTRKVQITYNHFAELKGICTPEQQAHFSELEPYLMQVIAPPPKKD